MLKAPDQWVDLGPWGLMELAGWLILGGIVLAILILQPLVWKIAAGVILGELGLMGLLRAFGKYRDFRSEVKTAIALRVQKQNQA